MGIEEGENPMKSENEIYEGCQYLAQGGFTGAREVTFLRYEFRLATSMFNHFFDMAYR